MRGYYTATEVINEALYKSGDIEKLRYEEAVMWFSSSFRDYELYHSTAVNEAWLPLTAINTINYPDDYVRLVKLSLPYNGEMFTFTLNQKMISPSDPIEAVYVPNRGEDEGLATSVQYGYASKGLNDAGYFKLNDKLRRIEFKQAFMNVYNYTPINEVLVTYLANGIGDLNKTYIPNDAVNLITADIAWKLALSDPNPKPFLIQSREKLYNQEMMKYDSSKLPSAEELLDAIYETSGQSIRR